MPMRSPPSGLRCGKYASARIRFPFERETDVLLLLLLSLLNLANLHRLELKFQRPKLTPSGSSDSQQLMPISSVSCTIPFQDLRTT